jgi:predicted esterase
MAAERLVAIRIHGRYLVDPAPAEPAALLIGCHGYGEAAEIQLERLRGIPGSERWTRVSVQGLHRFYKGRNGQIVASWMTHQNRELMIADNVAYMTTVAADVLAGSTPVRPIVFAGFSQGVATAFRAACASPHPAAVIALGGDVPPEIDNPALARLRGILIARGRSDEWYAVEKHEADLARLREAAAPLQVLALDAGHEWTVEFSRAAGRFLATL